MIRTLRVPLLYLVFLTVSLLVSFAMQSEVANAFTANQPDDGGRLVINAAVGPGNFPSDTSLSYLYVPESATTASVQMTDVINQPSGAAGRISHFSVGAINSSGNCNTPPYLASSIATNSTTVANNTTLTFTASATQVIAGNKVYCVKVQTAAGSVSGTTACFTASAAAWQKQMCFSNVTFRLNTSTSGGRLGNFAGSDNALGTGLFNGNVYGGSSDRFTVDWISFSPTCNVPATSYITLFDLDTYYTITNGDIRIQLERKTKTGSWSRINIDLAEAGYPAGNGSNAQSYWPANIPSGEGVSIKPEGSGYSEDFDYRVRILNIGGNNKVRVRIPYHQITVGLTCAPPATCTISNVLTFAGSSTIYPGDRIRFDVTVTGGSGYRVGVNGPSHPNEYGSTNIGNYLVTGLQYARGPTISTNSSTTLTVSNLGYSDSAAVDQPFYAPATSSNFDWGLVLAGVGWKPVTCDGYVTVTPTPAATCTLANSVVTSGTQLRLTWTSSNATSISINQGVGAVTPVAGGSRDIPLVMGRVYTATVTNSAGVTATCSTTAPAEPPVPVGVNCPSYPPNTLNFNTVQRVNLPRPPVGSTAGHDTSPWQVSSTGPTSGPNASGGAYTGSQNTVTATSQTRDVYQNYTYTRTVTYTQVYRYPTSPAISDITSIVDEYGETLDEPFIRTDASGNYIYLDYLKHFTNYPYDQHTPVITYRVGYERKQRIGTRTQTITVVRSGTATRTRANATSPWGSYSYSWGGIPGPNFPATSSPTSTTNNDNLSYSGRRDASSPILWSSTLPPISAPRIPPCFPRQYDATPTASGANLTPNRESPTQSTLTFTIPTALSFANGGGLRTATTVNGLAYTVNWAAEGYTSPSYSGSVSRTVNITNSSLSNNVTGIAGATGVLSESIPVNVPGNIRAGDRICWTITISQPTGTVKTGGEIWQPGGAVKTSTTCTLTAVDEPYTRFYSADVSAGGGFNTSAGAGTCTATNTNAQATGPMRSDILAGSGSQLAVFAIGAIDGIQPLSRSSRTPTQLAFSNASPSISARQFGGNFGTLLCAHNYFDDIPGNTAWDNTTANVDISALASGRYYFDGDVNVYGRIPDDAAAGRRIVVYVDGNVSVRENQNGSGTGRVGYANNAQWGSIDLIPSLYVISNGSINIDDGVTELDGSYVSQGGEINTCTVDTTFPIDQPTVLQRTVDCRTQLRINGAFLANRVNLLRTLGSLRESVALEAPSSTRAAETFIYNPTLWFTNGGNLPSNSKIQIDSYISLPPSL